ncbi:AGAP000572-PA-like protein [Anopheles sinensis]|uniref:AGAP000572-PA-like protein n=1 Tax=Anopheles sinensis TaxID=74873 RepID=A0A084VFL7_ANOSI|nr:AGAP000572-PA-like protein [Anopheles sinensis]
MYVFDRTPWLVLLANWMLVLLLVTADTIVHEPPDSGFDGDPCKLHNGSLGVCRPANQCSWLTAKSKTPEDLITCSFNMSLPIVCCMHEFDNTRTIIPAKRISEAQCDQFPKSSNLADHIINGVDAQFGEFPHMAALAYNVSNAIVFSCGSSLIAPRFLLTAAHCVTGVLFARLGVLELQPKVIVDTPIDIAIRNATRHPGYNPVTVSNDIALLELEEEVPANLPYAHPACLYMNTSGELLGPDVPLSVQGWGSVQVGDTNQPRLQKATVNLVDRETCQSKQVPTRRNRDGLHPTQICALGRDTNDTIADTCVGDSGGPLELVVDGRHYLVGIISAGYACGTTIPGIYTDIAPYIDWIESIVWPQH